MGQWLAPANLDKITEARIQFSSAVQNYLRMFASSHSDNCFTLQNQLEELNQQVMHHADSIRCKVEKLLQERQSVDSVTPPSNNLSGGAAAAKSEQYCKMKITPMILNNCLDPINKVSDKIDCGSTARCVSQASAGTGLRFLPSYCSTCADRVGHSQS